MTQSANGQAESGNKSIEISDMSLGFIGKTSEFTGSKARCTNRVPEHDDKTIKLESNTASHMDNARKYTDQAPKLTNKTRYHSERKVATLADKTQGLPNNMASHMDNTRKHIDKSPKLTDKSSYHNERKVATLADKTQGFPNNTTKYTINKAKQSGRVKERSGRTKELPGKTPKASSKAPCLAGKTTGLASKTAGLAAANAVTRGLGFAIKILLSRMLGAEALGIMEMAHGAHMLAITPLTAGLPAAVACETARAQNPALPLAAGKQIARRGGLIVTIAYLLLLPLIARLLGDARVLPALIFGAPCILLFGLSGVYNGHCYGIGRTAPPMIGELTEQLSRLALAPGALLMVDKLIQEKLTLLSPSPALALRAAAPEAGAAVAAAISLVIVARIIGNTTKKSPKMTLKNTTARHAANQELYGNPFSKKENASSKNADDASGEAQSRPVSRQASHKSCLSKKESIFAKNAKDASGNVSSQDKSRQDSRQVLCSEGTAQNTISRHTSRQNSYEGVFSEGEHIESKNAGDASGNVPSWHGSRQGLQSVLCSEGAAQNTMSRHTARQESCQKSHTEASPQKATSAPKAAVSASIPDAFADHAYATRAHVPNSAPRAVSTNSPLPSLKSTRRTLLRAAAPLTLSRLTATALRMLMGVMLPLRLAASGLTKSEAVAAFGQIGGMAMPLMLLPCMATGAMASVGAPMFSRAQKTGRPAGALLRKMLAFAAPLGAGSAFLLYFAADFIAEIIYRQPPLAGVLRAMCPLALLLPVCQIMGTALTGLNRQTASLRASVTGAFITLILCYFLPARAELRLTGAAYAYIAGQAAVLMMQFLAYFRGERQAR